MGPSPSRYRWRSRRALVTLLLAVPIAGLALIEAWAWYQLRAARADLLAYHPHEARAHLAQCLAIWPAHAEAHLLSGRAARQSDDFEVADRELRTCQRLLGDTPSDLALEWALLQASSGNLGEVEEFLQRRVVQDPERAPLVWEASAEGYIRLYRIPDALSCAERWLETQPDNLRALELRGLAYHHVRQSRRAAEDFRRVLELDPTRVATRGKLAMCLLDMGSYDEALPHLEKLARTKPDDLDVQVRLARCHNLLGRPEQARQILDAALDKHPEHALALRTRGQFALADGQPEQAERWLRHAAEVQPDDYQTQWLLFRSLQQQNKSGPAQAQLRTTEEVKERAERLGELKTRKLFEQPLDPALQYETGVLLLRNGHISAGEGWLLSALNLDPNFLPAHAALAKFYEERGDAPKAEAHRRRAAAVP